MIVIDYWIIRRRSDGFTLSQAHGRMGRGGSHVEPCNPEKERPRLFTNYSTAKGYLTTWLKGKVISQYHEYDDYGTEIILKTIPVPSRKREDMEVVCVTLEF